jgi:hypothetical protein
MLVDCKTMAGENDGVHHCSSCRGKASLPQSGGSKHAAMKPHHVTLMLDIAIQVTEAQIKREMAAVRLLSG